MDETGDLTMFGNPVFRMKKVLVEYLRRHEKEYKKRDWEGEYDPNAPASLRPEDMEASDEDFGM